jgi:hypothetical protein
MKMARQWEFIADMNLSGTVTVSDVWLWVKWLYFWPGDGLIYLAITRAPDLAKFFELSASKFGGPLSLFMSFPVWVAFLILMFLTWNMMNRLGRRAAEALMRPFRRKEEALDPNYRRTNRK